MKLKSKKIARRIAVSSGAAVAALGLGAGTALAAPLTYTVTAGTATSADSPINWHASTVGPTPQITFTDVTDGVTMTCESGTAAGTIKVGSGLSGNNIGDVSDPNPSQFTTSFSGCTGLGINLTVKPHLDWNLNVQGPTSGGQTAGDISGIDATVVDSATDGSVCSFDVKGSVGGSYDNNTTELELPGDDATLEISNVNGCLGLISDPAQATYEATYKVTADNPDYNPIHINSE